MTLTTTDTASPANTLVEEIDADFDVDTTTAPIDLTKVERSGKLRCFTARRNEAAYRAWLDADDIAA